MPRLALALALLSPLSAAAALRLAEDPGRQAERKLREAWSLSERAERYRFTSQVTQTTLPAPRLANAGRAARKDQLTVQGHLDRPANTLRLSLWDRAESAFDPETALEVEIVDGQARGRAPRGEWQALEDFSDAFAPGGDAAAFLLAARHVTFLGLERRELAAFGDTLTSRRYHFAVDGRALSEVFATQLEAALRREGKLPPGTSLRSGSVFRQTAGSGEAWLDEDGLPLRLRAEIEFPEQANGERIQLQVQTDFTGFDRSALLLGGAGLTRRVLALGQVLPRQLGTPASQGLAVVLVVLLAALAGLRRQPRRRAYRLTAGLLLAAVLSGELARAAPLLWAAADGEPARAAAAAAGHKATLAGKAMSDPEPVPAAIGDGRASGAAPVQGGGDAELSGPDTDRDGLPDSLETVWTTNPSLPDTDGDGLGDGAEVQRCLNRGAGLAGGRLVGENATRPACPNPRAADTDGDGLNDKQEALFLGTGPNSPDSDGDNLGDALEVQGFGGQRFSDPLSPDTDGDGLLDGMECPSQPCKDSGGGAEADILELDNDGDGFIGRFDLAPDLVLGRTTPFTGDNPFQLEVANLQPGRTVLLDFQVRPTNANHVGYARSVLDWPTGDTGGQVQRRLDSTFADVNPVPAALAGAGQDPQRYGDMRLLPMLEIEMDGRTAPLPRRAVTTTLQLKTAPLLAEVQLIKQTEDIQLFGFTVSEPEDLKIRVRMLGADHGNYSLALYQASCEDVTAPARYTTGILSQDGEVTLPGAELAQLADGAHVARLLAAGQVLSCLAIPKVVEQATETPLSFLGNVVSYGSVSLEQVGADVRLTPRLPGGGGRRQLVIVGGSCRARGPEVARVDAGRPGLIAGAKAVSLADGQHALILQEGERALACSPLGNVVNGAAGETEMIDQSGLQPLGIAVSEKEVAGTVKLVAHVPLQVATDERSGVTSGLAGSMRFQTSAASTAWQHQVRLSWWVQVLTDMCSTPPADYLAGQDEQSRLRQWCGAEADRLQLVHVYDESWQLAGLSLREEHDYDLAVVFEDPATDQNRASEDYLWHLAKALDEQFVSGVDCVRIAETDGCARDGQRDYTLGSLYNTFHNGANAGTSDLDRLGIPRATFFVEKLDTQLNDILDLDQVLETHIPRLLTGKFLAGGQPLSPAPLLLFAGESKGRSLDLGSAGYALPRANGVKLDLDPANEDPLAVLTLASLSWAPYRHRDAGTGPAWEAYPYEEYWDLLEVRLKAGTAFGVTDDPASQIVSAGKIRLAQTYFAYLHNGRAGLVQTGSTVLGQWDVNASAYLSRSERRDLAVDAGALAETLAQGTVINVVIEPFFENLAKNIMEYNFQQQLMARDATALLKRVITIPGTDTPDFTAGDPGAIWSHVGGGVADDLTDSYFRNFRASGLKGMGGRALMIGAAGLAGAALVAGIAGGIYNGARGDGLGVPKQVLNGINAAVEVAGAVSLLKTANEAVTKAGIKSLRVVTDALNSSSRAAQIAGLVGLLVGEIVNYSLLVYRLVSAGVTWFGLEANLMASTSIAATFVAGLMLALAFTGVGAIIVAIIGLIDGLVTLICGFLDKDQTESVAGQAICRGISGWLVELVAYGLYAQNEITRMDDPHRLNYTRFRPGMGDPARGFVPQAPVTLDLSVRNTLSRAQLPANIGIFYGFQFNESVLQSARFDYQVVGAQPAEGSPQLHDNLALDLGANPWQVLERDDDGDIRTVYDDTEVPSAAPLALSTRPGINRPLPAYLAEGFVVPVQECVTTLVVPLAPPVVACWVRGRADTSYNDLLLQFDVFPATLDEFYTLEALAGPDQGRFRQSWSNNGTLPFPALVDADGDGLRYDADHDDSRWDADGDGLGDALELQRHSAPARPDSDDDGLPDPQEAVWGTQPDLADSDGDGLTDGQELTGWAIGYGVRPNGDAAIGWIRSDPLAQDLDRDAIPDPLERANGTNPAVANDPTVLKYEGQVREPHAPLLLTRFEEPAATLTFADTASAAGGGSTGNVAGCQSPGCPNAGLRGAYGRAVVFDGSDDYLAIPPNPAIGALRTNFTLSAWVKPSKLSGEQTVLQIGPGGPNGLGGLSFGLQDDDLFVQLAGKGAAGRHVQPLPAGTLALDRWAHIALEFYDNNGRVLLWVDGRNFPEKVLGFTKEPSPAPVILIGAGQQPAGTVAPGKDGSLPQVRVQAFAGGIDEVQILGWVSPSDANIQAFLAGRYNPDDALLRPGQDVAYDSHVANVLTARSAAGRRTMTLPAGLTSSPSTRQALVLEAGAGLSFPQSFYVRTDAPSGRYPLAQSVEVQLRTPERDVWRSPAAALRYSWPGPKLFVGLNDNTVSDPNLPLSLNNTSFTISGWLRPLAGGGSQRRGILGRNSGQPNAYPYLVTAGAQLRFGYGSGSGSAAVEAGANDGDANVLNLDAWNFVALRYTLAADRLSGQATFFVNGKKLNTTSMAGAPATSDTSFFLGRANNVGRLRLTKLELVCEGDGIGDGEYSLVANGGSLWQGDGTEPKSWPLDLELPFHNNQSLTICEDDNGNRADCLGGDEDLGGPFLSTDMATIPGATGTYSAPAGKTECAYDWGNASYPDITKLSYSFHNDSQPFMGELKDFEIHGSALSDADIQSIGSHADTVAHFRLDDQPGSESFDDYSAYHLLSCQAPACPEAGVDGPQLSSLAFDGQDDQLLEAASLPAADRIGADIAGKNSGFAVSMWIKPEPARGAQLNSVTHLLSFSDASNPNGSLRLVQKQADGVGYLLSYRDHESDITYVANETVAGACRPRLDEVPAYGKWNHVAVSMNAATKALSLYFNGEKCATPSLQPSYVPRLGDVLSVGAPFHGDRGDLTYKGGLDDLVLLRRPLTDQDARDLFRKGVARHWPLDEADYYAGTTRIEPVKSLKRRGLRFTGEASFLRDAQNYDLPASVAYGFIDGEVDQNPENNGEQANPVTIALWVKAEDLAARKRPLLSALWVNPSNGADQNNDFAITLEDGVPKINYWLGAAAERRNKLGGADRKIGENVWQHLAFRKNGDELTVFVNGLQAGPTSSGWRNAFVRLSSVRPLLLGRDGRGAHFKGLIDEVMVYRAALSDQEIRELYNHFNGWVDETIQNEVTVDAEAPRSTLELQSRYLPQAPQLLHVSTSDATTGVRHVALGVDGGAGPSWVGAVGDDSDPTGNTWLPLFEPTREGVYTLSARATDRVGNTETPGPGTKVYVDGRPPIININNVQRLVRPAASGSEEAVWTVHLVGASFDPILEGTSQAGSGTAAIDVTLTNLNGAAATLFPTQRAAIDPSSGEWTVNYRLNAANPTGDYQVDATAVDQVGNRSAAPAVRMRLDATAPEAHVTALVPPSRGPLAAAPGQAGGPAPDILGADSRIGGAVTERPDDVVAQAEVAGVAAVDLALEPLFEQGSTFRNQPLPAATLLQLPLDESARAAGADQAFADLAPASRGPASCAEAACPTAGTPGRAGLALAFDGVDDALALPAAPAIGALTNDFTVGAWVKPASFPHFTRFLSSARTAGSDGFGFGARDRALLFTSYGVQDYRGTRDILTPGVWQHVAVHLNASNAAEFYLNGLLVETVPGTAPAKADVDDRLLVGATTEPGDAATAQHFHGVLDEVTLSRGRPSAADWALTLGARPTLHLDFDDAFLKRDGLVENAAGLQIEGARLATLAPGDPNLHHPGRVGGGALFAEQGLSGVVVQRTATGVLPHQAGSFTMALWVYLNDANEQAGFAMGGASGTRAGFSVGPSSVTAILTEHPSPNLAVDTASLLDAWHHVALTYEDGQRILYLDGRELGRDAPAAPTLDTLEGGTAYALGHGGLDDLRIYRHALNAREVGALAAMGWRPAALDSSTSWSADLPAGLEGFYELRTRGTDALGNVDNKPEELLTWRGIVDTLAPRLLGFHASPGGARVDFELEVEDFDLAPEGVTPPPGCLGQLRVAREPYASAWYLAMAAQVADAQEAERLRGRSHRMILACRAGYASTNDKFTICDLAGNCTEAVYTGPNVGASPTPTATSATATPTASTTPGPRTATPTAGATGTSRTATPTRSATPDKRTATPTGQPGTLRPWIWLPSLSQNDGR